MSDFTVADLEEALDNDELNGGEGFNWWEPESANEPNPEFDQALRDKYEALRSDYYATRTGTDERLAAQNAYYAFSDVYGHQIYPTRSCPSKVTVNGVEYDIKKVDGYGGEGQGDSLWVVIEVGGRLFRKDGWYASYSGGEFDGELREVKASTKTVTVYDEDVVDDDSYGYSSY